MLKKRRNAKFTESDNRIMIEYLLNEKSDGGGADGGFKADVWKAIAKAMNVAKAMNESQDHDCLSTDFPLPLWFKEKFSTLYVSVGRVGRKLET